MSNTRILVVTNDFDMGEQFTVFLDSQNYTSKLCADLKKFPEIILDYLPDLIFWLFHSDIPQDLPDIMSSTRQTFRKNERPLNFLAYPRDSFDPRFETLADAFVVSPFHVSDVLYTIEGLLKRRP